MTRHFKAHIHAKALGTKPLNELPGGFITSLKEDMKLYTWHPSQEIALRDGALEYGKREFYLAKREALPSGKSMIRWVKRVEPGKLQDAKKEAR